MSRLRQMCDEGSETWDLSDNDRAAISTVLASHYALLEALKVARNHVELAYARNPQVASFAADIRLVNAAIAKAEGSLP
jgi:hypothetical protein